MERGNYLSPYRQKKARSSFKGERTVYVDTHDPSTAKPGDTLCISLPKIDNELIIPETVELTFDLGITLDPAEPGTTVNTYPVNNLAANIFSKIVIKLGSTEVYNLEHAHLYNTYRDLWLTDKQRANSIINGIQNEELRKLRADVRAKLPNVQESNVKLRDVYGKKYSVPLRFELIDDHSPLPTWKIEEKITFEMTVNKKEYVLNYSNASTADFRMTNICLKYETIKEEFLTKDILNALNGYRFLFEHIQFYHRDTISKAKTLVNQTITVSRQSLKGILILFMNRFEDGRRDSEEFPNPSITKLKLTIGKPGAIYNDGYNMEWQWPEAFKHFVPEELKSGQVVFMDAVKYYSENKFGLWIDLRTTEDNNLHGSGRKLKDHEIKMEITKKHTGDGEYIMHIFIVSDARVLLRDDMKFGDVEYYATK